MSLPLASITMFAALTMGLVLVVSAGVDPGRRFPRLVWYGIYLLVGIVLALVLGLNALRQVPGTRSGAGQIVTGLAIGGAAIFWSGLSHRSD